MSAEPRFCPACGAKLSAAPDLKCPGCGRAIVSGERDPHFRAFWQSFNTRALILCAIAVPVGLVMKLPVVWGLALAGICVAAYRLRVIRRSAR